MSAHIVEMENINILVSWSVKQGLLEKMGVSGPDELGQILHDENVRSVNYRYDENTVPDQYKHTPMPVDDVSDKSIDSLIGNLDYQCCETNDWNSSRGNECLAFMELDILPRFPEVVSSLQDARHPMIVEALIERGHGPNETLDDRDQSLPLHWAKSPEIAEVLISAGADVNSLNNNHETPLHMRSLFGNQNTVQVLLDHGANPEARDLNGNTPLHSATRYGRHGVAEMLVNSGADPLLTNDDGISAFELAETKNIPITKSVLERAVLANKLKASTQEAAGAWCPSPDQADAFAERMTNQAQGNSQVAPQQHRARARL